MVLTGTEDEDLVKQVATVDGTILEFAVDLCHAPSCQDQESVFC